MKMLAEYLDTAIKFEQMAAQEKDPKLKADFEKQAAAYRKLAEKRAKEYGLKMPSDRR
jgi:ABC-type Zn uptake system ZnuABC Zn-binding protein ZnuA